MEPYFAVHEAGHLVAAWNSASVETINVAFIDKNGGRVLYAHYVTGNPADLWSQLVILLSGIAAELWVRKTVRPGVSEEDDLPKAIKVAEQLAQKVNPWKAFPADTDDKETISRMFSRDLSPAVKHLLEAAYLKSRTILTRTDKDYYIAVNALLTGARLNHKTLETILGPRPRTYPDGPFVLPSRSPKDPTWGQKVLRMLQALFD